MNSQGIRPNHIDGLLRLFEAKCAVARLRNQLWRANIGNEKSVGGILAGHCVAGGYLWIDDSGPLATNAKGQPVLFRGPREVAVDRCNIGMPSGE